MKIALYNVTTTTQTGGVESFVWELARYLTTEYPDCQVDIIGGQSPAGFHQPTTTPSRVRVLTRPYITREQLRRLPLMRRLYGQTKLLERLSFGLTTLPLLARERYDILHIQKPYDLPLAQLTRRLFGTRILFGCHGKDFFPFDRLFARKVTEAVSCSHYNAHIVAQHYGVQPEVVYNGIDVELFAPRPVKPELRAQFAAPEEFIIMQVGRQVRWKGAQYLLHALALLQQRGVPVKAILAGDGPYRKDLEALSHRLGVAEITHFTGNLPNRDLPDYYALADVVVGTSFANETFGIALCEAAACEKPVVASNFGGFREVIKEGETGYLYQPQDAAELADKLESLLKDAATRERLGKTGRRYVVENFTWPCVAERVYNEYRRILAK
ncbi:MAG TPA: glycosyltransferase family 4 protein [Chloroflexia bacterium]|nr:glycosyltransferase family 4 protein [Chloroflexia bacterium]